MWACRMVEHATDYAESECATCVRAGMLRAQEEQERAWERDNAARFAIEQAREHGNKRRRLDVEFQGNWNVNWSNEGRSREDVPLSPTSSW